MKPWQKAILALAPCDDAAKWLMTQPSAAAAWRDCKRGDWMLWIAAKGAGGPGSARRRRLTLAACECARLALQRVPAGESRPLIAIETAEAWARGEPRVTLDDVRSAAYAAYAATYAATYAAASSAASAAAYAAAYAAAVAAYAAYSATYAAYAASYAAAVAAADAAARSRTLAKCADIVRKHYTARELLASIKQTEAR